MGIIKLLRLSILLIGPAAIAQTKNPPLFPDYLSKSFDYSTFTRFDAEAPPADSIYQSNGFMAVKEVGFGGEQIIIPATVEQVPTNTSNRLSAIEIDPPVFIDSAGRNYNFARSPAKRSLTYFADRSVYRAAFDDGPEVSLTVYPVYGKPEAVIRINIIKAPGTLRVILQSREDGFRILGSTSEKAITYGSSRWPYRMLLAARPDATVRQGEYQWDLRTRSEAALMIALGGTQEEAEASLRELKASSDLFDKSTHRAWNDYLASAPLVAPAEPIRFTVGTSGKPQSISPQDLVRSELWAWRGLLNTTCQNPYMPASPLMIADWNVFMGMWGNDGIAEAISMAATGRAELARASILNWFRYAVNFKGDGTAAWTIFPSAQNTFQAAGPERDTQSIAAQGSLVGEYVRLTGDTGILNEKLGGPTGDRTLWQALLAYQRNLLRVRDSNHDHLIDWLHTYETGWDDKNSPFFDLKGHATSAMNEQVFNLWSLQEMVYLSKLQGHDPSPWQREFAAAEAAVRSQLWDANTQRYWDMDLVTGKLWTQGENLDAYYFLYYEPDQTRVAAMMHRLRDPAKFNGALLPTMAFDTPQWGGYWRGPAWPRVISYVALALTRCGESKEGFNWLARAINSNLGPLLPENVDPKRYPPGDHPNGPVRIMGYDALDALVFPDVAGLQTWGGQDLTIVPPTTPGKVYVRGQRWMGDRYDAVLEPGQPTHIWRNGLAMAPLPSNRTWRARKQGQTVVFESLHDPRP